jgi:5-methylcytosine-specific restriction endonuclease McrA
MVSSEPTTGLAASVLVLNRYYRAVHVIGARRAICLLVRDLAEVLHWEEGQFFNYDFPSWQAASELKADSKQPDEDWVRSVNFELQVPRVVRLLTYEKTPRQAVRFNRRSIFARDDHQCMYCGGRFPTSQLSLDHVIPRSRGGQTDWENVVSSCVVCNVRKGGRTPQEARMGLVRTPSRPKRSPILSLKLRNPKYASWRVFLDGAHAVEVA